MKNKSAKQLYNEYRIKFALLAVAYAVVLALVLGVMKTNMLLGIAIIVMLAVSLRAVFEGLREKTLEVVIFEDLDPEKFNELVELGAFKKAHRLRILGAISAGDYDKAFAIIAETEGNSKNPLEKANNIYRKGYVYFEKREFSKLPAVVAEFEALKRAPGNVPQMFANFTVFDKYDAFADEDYQYVVDVCEQDLRLVSRKAQNHKITKLNVSFYRAVSLYMMGELDAAREAFEEIVAFAPKMHKATLSRRYLEEIAEKN